MVDQDHSTAAPNLVAIDVAKDWNSDRAQWGRRRRKIRRRMGTA